MLEKDPCIEVFLETLSQSDRAFYMFLHKIHLKQAVGEVKVFQDICL